MQLPHCKSVLQPLVFGLAARYQGASLSGGSCNPVELRVQCPRSLMSPLERTLTGLETNYAPLLTRLLHS